MTQLLAHHRAFQMCPQYRGWTSLSGPDKGLDRRCHAGHHYDPRLEKSSPHYKKEGGITITKGHLGQGISCRRSEVGKYAIYIGIQNIIIRNKTHYYFVPIEWQAKQHLMNLKDFLRFR